MHHEIGCVVLTWLNVHARGFRGAQGNTNCSRVSSTQDTRGLSKVGGVMMHQTDAISWYQIAVVRSLGGVICDVAT